MEPHDSSGAQHDSSIPSRRRFRRAAVCVFAAVLLIYAFVGFVQTRDQRAELDKPVSQPLHPVATRFVADDTELLDCSDDPCFQQAFGNIALREGPRQALELVEEVYGDGGSASCHRVVHTIGAASLTRNNGNVARTFAQGSSVCWSGYYHGVLEYSLLGVKTYGPKHLGAVARTLCRDAVDHMTGWIAWQCLHGLGHGLMITTGMNLPLSLRVCKLLDTWREADGCKGGVFMENIQPSFGVPSRWQRADDPVYPCNEVAREDKARCYQMVTSRILPAVGDDWTRAAAMCAGVEKAFSSVCFGSLGRDASSRSGRNPEEITTTCAVARPYRGESSCITAAAMDMTANFSSGKRARALCEVVAQPLRSDCYFGIGVVMALFRKAPSARAADCRALTTSIKHIRDCLRGGRSSTMRI